MARKEEIKKVQALIDRSGLLKKEDKPRLKEYVVALDSEQLEKVKKHLESEKNFIVRAFEKGVSGVLEDDPTSGLFKELDIVFTTATRLVRRGQEEDSHAEEKEEAENLLTDL